MSEQRKRLTDAQFSRAREAYIADVIGDVSEDALFDDHLQAREDRKALARRLRSYTGGHDHGCSFYRLNFGVPKCDCETGRLLAEVDPQ